MIKTINYNEPFEVPVDASFIVEFQTGFTINQLAGATITVPFYLNGLTQGEWPAAAEGTTSVLLRITPGMLAPGEYELSPKIVIGADTYRMVRAVAMKALANYVTTRPKVGCYQIA